VLPQPFLFTVVVLFAVMVGLANLPVAIPQWVTLVLMATILLSGRLLSLKPTSKLNAFLTEERTKPLRRYVYPALGIVILLGIARLMLRDVIHDPDSRYIYPFMLALTAAFLAAMRWPPLRDWIAGHVRIVRIAGGTILAASFAWLGVGLYLSMSGYLSAKTGAWAFCAVFFIGWMTMGVTFFVSRSGIGKDSVAKI
jgi:hypothetical protein